MSVILEALVKLLDGHIGLYETLAGLLDQERSALFNRDMETLGEAGQHKAQTIEEINRSVTEVAEAIKTAARHLRRPTEPFPTLAELAAAAPAPWSGSLRRAGLALARLKSRIALDNDSNKHFIQEALEVVSGSIAILSGAAVRPKAGYTASGRRTSAQDQGPVKLSREV